MCCSTWVFCSCPTELFIAVTLTSLVLGAVKINSSALYECVQLNCLSSQWETKQFCVHLQWVAIMFVLCWGLHENLVSVDSSSCRAVWLRILSKANVQFKYCFMSRWVGNGTPSNFVQNINIIWLNGLWIYGGKKWFHYMDTEVKGLSYNKWELSV